ncbi:hypothetical protein VTK26DRAFT_815 [Humicola hyalothermophila]
MKQRRLLRFHGLRRPRIRQTWNKYNLYNLARMKTPPLYLKTFFQQKWIAKALTRGYHGEHIKEYQWERMFSRRPLSAVSMDPGYMARHDGSEQAAGRGSGLQGFDSKASIGTRGNLREKTPYMQQVFAPMERRLDIAIFRALFASSARQARQFVIHGFVTVNGKKMTHPSYLLNPGDMFQVDVERVMMATGKPKKPSSGIKVAPEPSEPAEPEADADEGAAEAPKAAEKELDPAAAKAKHLATLKEIKRKAQHVLASKQAVRAKHKQELRAFLAQVKAATQASTNPRINRPVEEMDTVEKELSALLTELTLTPAERAERRRERAKRAAEQQAAAAREDKKRGKGRSAEKSSSASEDADDSPRPTSTSSESPTAATSSQAKPPAKPNPPSESRILNRAQRVLLRKLMEEDAANPYDPSKPYQTPWQPRDYMAPFAFIPRYLEVNPRICAAVYLRHPVARPGRSEVPTPFSPVLSQLAFNWYLRRS